MAAITDEQALNFVDQRIRPLSERLRAIEALIEDMETDWFNGTNNLATSTDTVENRSAEGLPNLTWQEVTDTVVALMAVRDVVTETAGRAALVEKACVRPLQVTL